MPHAGLQVVVATPTRAQVAGLAVRLAALVPLDLMELAMKDAEDDVPDWVRAAQIAQVEGPSVRIVTLASAKRNLGPKCDVMIVDESYQATYAGVAAENGLQTHRPAWRQASGFKLAR